MDRVTTTELASDVVMGNGLLKGSPRMVVLFEQRHVAGPLHAGVVLPSDSGPVLGLPYAAIDAAGLQTALTARGLPAAHACGAGRGVLREAWSGAAAAAETLRCVRSATDGNFVAVLVADAPLADDEERLGERDVRLLEERASPSGTNGTNSTGQARPPSYFPTYVWSWLLVVFSIVAFTVGAVYALSEVQVPPKLLTTDAVASKKNN